MGIFWHLIVAVKRVINFLKSLIFFVENFQVFSKYIRYFKTEFEKTSSSNKTKFEKVYFFTRLPYPSLLTKTSKDSVLVAMSTLCITLRSTISFVKVGKYLSEPFDIVRGFWPFSLLKRSTSLLRAFCERLE